ncbi:hypothetical protein BRD17_02990 [Halobacteriales archaeon SW_7_68_16]|nr:MAG: hypothetical protein BRD17_02990 [Halobacteriales archaeon SW_7_68_16]
MDVVDIDVERTGDGDRIVGGHVGGRGPRRCGRPGGVSRRVGVGSGVAPIVPIPAFVIVARADLLQQGLGVRRVVGATVVVLVVGELDDPSLLVAALAGIGLALAPVVAGVVVRP